PAKAWDPVSFNRYSYCFGDPVNRWDPTGADSPKDGPYDAPVWYNDAYSDAISRGASPDDALRAGETAAAAAEAMRRAFLTPEQRALEDMRAAANTAVVAAAWASMSSGPSVNRAAPGNPCHPVVAPTVMPTVERHPWQYAVLKVLSPSTLGYAYATCGAGLIYAGATATGPAVAISAGSAGATAAPAALTVGGAYVCGAVLSGIGAALIYVDSRYIDPAITELTGMR
ncbi:MAG: hypothetical protein Q7U89_06020, partial [Coriobacteriia bacterium]|nr:hypothetical protein [Coriobacteriia bacterium]